MLASIFGHNTIDYAMQFNLDSAATLINYFGINISDLTLRRNLLLKQSVEKGNINLVNALLSVGAAPTIELAQRARELGYLKIMHRFLFTTLAKLPELQRCSQIIDLSGLFK